MTLQYRPQAMPNAPAYAPSRDLTNFFPELCKTVAYRLEERRLPELHAWLDAEGVTDEDLGEACGAYCRFMVIAHEQPSENFEDVLRRAGWFDVKPAARIAYVAYVGMTMTGYFFMGIRDVMILGQDARTEVAQLRHYGERALLLLSLPRWKRWFYFRFRGLARFWRRRLRRKGE